MPDAPGAASTPRPNLFLVGAPRCGTSALHAYLAEHPDVFMSRVKEPHHFSQDVNRAVAAYSGRENPYADRARYLELFEGAGDARVRGESSIYYLYSDEAADGVRAFDPEARIVVQVREPLDLLRSVHSKLRSMGDEPARTLPEALSLEPARRRGEHVPRTARWPDLLFYSDYVRLAEGVERWRARFGPERVKVIVYDDFERDSAACYADVLAFLGLSQRTLPKFPTMNPGTEPRSVRLAALLRDLSIEREHERRAFTLRLRARVHRSLDRWNARPARRAPLPVAFVRATRARFRDEVLRLGALLDRDLAAAWGYAE